MRILLKISWEALAWEKWFWFDFDVVDSICDVIKTLVKENVEIWIVVWWWNLVRWAEISMLNIDRANADNMWMLAININSIVLADVLTRKKIEVKTMNSFWIDWVIERFNKPKAIKALKDWKIIIFAWWTGNSHFTTDTAGVLRALEIDADLMIKATKVNWIYDKDPIKNKDAKLFEKITYKEVLEKNIRVMDLTAVSLAKEYNLPLKVVSLYEKKAIFKAVKGKKVWTSIE